MGTTKHGGPVVNQGTQMTKAGGMLHGSVDSMKTARLMTPVDVESPEKERRANAGIGVKRVKREGCLCRPRLLENRNTADGERKGGTLEMVGEEGRLAHAVNTDKR
ncbi:hypothetical protein TRVL_05643 [Trypanosoma vivax]|nr:hypothetical protein TRVL_05643 [Trypanosoma vivax]